MKIFYHANIHTLNPKQPQASAIVIDQGRILAVGQDAELLDTYSSWAPRGEQVDAGGKVIIPGLTDAHIHLMSYSLGLNKVDCETTSREECLRRVAERAQNTLSGEWILGHGWNQNEWSEGFGYAADLDEITTQHPVYLTAKSLHAGWANSAALQRAGLNDQSADPVDGRLGRSADGSLNGILYESAMEFMEKALPEPALDQVTQAIQNAQPILWKMGLTGVHDYGDRNCFAALQILHNDQKLKLRVIEGIPLQDLPHAAALGLRSGFGDDFLRIGSIKAFADGALGPQTAAMFQPYENSTERGMLLMDGEEIYEHARKAYDNGFSLAVHAIGDRANHEVLNAFAHLKEDCEKADRKLQLRNRIEHVQLLHPGDVARLAELGVIASMQPIHATSDMITADRHWGARSALSYAWKSELESGAVLAFGSDAPVESPNPFWGLHAAVTRRRADGSPGPEGWYPEQRLSVESALQGYTTGAAYAAGVEDRLGQLAPGFLADMLILDADPFTCPPDQLRSLRPLATMVGGEWVWKE